VGHRFVRLLIVPALLGALFGMSVLSVSAAQDEGDTGESEGTGSGTGTGTYEEDEEDAPRSQPLGELPVPRPVYVGMYVFHVPELDLSTNSYLVDFYLWFRWQGDDIDPSSTFEFMNMVSGWDLMEIVVYTDDDGEPAIEDLGEGWRYQVFHYQGRFGHAFDMRAYPFDSQELTIMLEDTDMVVDDMTYVVDEGTLALHPGLIIPGWNIEGVEADVIEQDYPTNFGDTRRAPGADRYSRFRYSVRVSRPVLGYAATTLLPIAIVMLITMVMFLIESKYFEGRLGLGITSLISAVALQLTAAADLPANGYLVLLDHVYNLSYAVIFLSLAESVVSVRIYDRGETERARRLDLIAMAAMLALFFGGTGLLIFLHL
jgi:hypothetical protein